MFPSKYFLQITQAQVFSLQGDWLATRAVSCLREMIKVHRNAFLSKAFPSPACGKCLNFTTNTSALKLIMGFASASKSNTLRRSNFWFLPEPTYMDAGPADTGPRGGTSPQSTRLSCAGSAGTTGGRGPTMLCPARRGLEGRSQLASLLWTGLGFLLLGVNCK